MTRNRPDKDKLGYREDGKEWVDEVELKDKKQKEWGT